MFIFVYGSLKRKCSNEGMMHSINANYIGDYVTLDANYDLADLGAFPGLIPGSFYVAGQVWDILANTQPVLDRFEGHPRFYERRMILIDQFPEEMPTYFLNTNSKYVLREKLHNTVKGFLDTDPANMVRYWRLDYE